MYALRLSAISTVIHCALHFSAQMIEALALHSLIWHGVLRFLAYLFLKFDLNNQENIIIVPF